MIGALLPTGLPPARHERAVSVSGITEVAMLALLLNLLGVILLALAAAGVSLSRVHLGWAGLAVLAFTALVLPAL